MAYPGTSPEASTVSVNFGDFELHALSDGFFRLDGGAMFGIIPKPLWDKRIHADERNRIRLSLRSLLVKTPRGNVLVDTGIGEGFDPRQLDQLGLEKPPRLAESLSAAGLDAGDIDFVVNTHLHFDHAGGNTALQGGNRVAAFPKARYVISKTEGRAASNPGERSRGSYRDWDFLPLREAGAVDLVEAEAEILPGVRVVPTPGHTEGHLSVLVQSGGLTAFAPGDAVPTASHLELAWVMGYDLAPQETVETKKKWLGRCADSGWLLFLEHDPDRAFVTVERTKKGFAAAP